MILGYWSHDFGPRDLEVVEIATDGTKTSLGPVFSATGNKRLAAVWVDDRTDNIFVSYARGENFSHMYVETRVLRDGGPEWRRVHTSSTNNPDDIVAIYSDPTNGFDHRPSWFSDELALIYTTTRIYDTTVVGGSTWGRPGRRDRLVRRQWIR